MVMMSRDDMVKSITLWSATALSAALLQPTQAGLRVLGHIDLCGVTLFFPPTCLLYFRLQMDHEIITALAL